MYDNQSPSQDDAKTDDEKPSQATTELRTSNPSESMNEDASSLTRRNALFTIAAGATTALAGCSETGPSGNSTSSNGSDEQVDGNAINNLETNGYDLVVSLNTDADTDRVRLVDQDDSELSSTSVGAGVGQVSLSYRGYQPGKYTLLAVSSGNVIDEETITFDPELTITEVGSVSQETPEFTRIPENRKDADISSHGQIWLSIENTGNVPVTVTNITFVDPDTDDDYQIDAPADQSLYNLKSHSYGKATEADKTTINPGGTFNALSDGAPYPLDSMCTGRSGTVEITVTSRELSDFSIEATYTRSTEQGDWQDDVMYEKNKECPTSFEEVESVTSE